MRCFLVIDLPNSLAAGVATVQDRLSDANGLRLTNPGGAHVTLKFLGEVSPDHVGVVEDAVESAAEAVGVGPFDASVSGLGVFPSLDYIRIAWVGVGDGTAKLTRLHETIERETMALGFDPEDHEFTLHITLARMDGAHGKVLVRCVVGGESPTVRSFRVRKVCLEGDNLGSGGPKYETIARVSL